MDCQVTLPLACHSSPLPHNTLLPYYNTTVTVPTITIDKVGKPLVVNSHGIESLN